MTSSEQYLALLYDQIGQAVAVKKITKEYGDFYIGFCSRVKSNAKLSDVEKLKKYQICASAVGANIQAGIYGNPFVILRDSLIKTGQDLTELGTEVTGRVGDVYKTLFKILEFLTRPVILIVLLLIVLGFYYHKPIIGYVKNNK